MLGLGAELTRALGVDVDVVALEQASIPLVDAIVREGVTVFEGTPGLAASWRSNRSLVSAKLFELADRTARVRDKVPPNALVLAQDRDLLDIVSFNLMLAVQCCADIASHRVTSTGSELRRAVGLGNVVAHG